MSLFTLHPRLEADSIFIADGPLSQIRLMNDTRYPWLLLIPQVANATEWIDLDGAQQRLLLAEINQLSILLRNEPHVEKLNIATLGNIVSQLHIHLIGRNQTDAAWPNPVWGNGTAQPYAADTLSETVAKWQQQL